MIFRKKDKKYRAIIDGKLYDTSKSEKVLEYGYKSWIPSLDCTYVLYKGEKEWFVVMRGHIIPRSEYGAKQILAEWDVDKYIEYFGEPKLA